MKRKILIWMSVPIVFFIVFIAASPRTSSVNVSKEPKDSVVFIYNPKDPRMPIGTGFFVALQSADTSHPGSFKFILTNQHVIANLTSVEVRLNNTKNSVSTVQVRLTPGTVFQSSQKEVDLVAISVPDVADTVPTVFDLSLIPDEAVLSKLEVHEGTDVYTIGYLSGYAGLKRNYPVSRFGKIASLTDEYWFSSPRHPGLAEQAYLVEVYNTPGTSGSPVLLQKNQFDITEGNLERHRAVPPILIGVVKGYPAIISPVKSLDSLSGRLADPAMSASVPVVQLSQGLAAVEPVANLRALLVSVADDLNKAGRKVSVPAPLAP